jgi:hypothetical protein
MITAGTYPITHSAKLYFFTALDIGADIVAAL